MDIKSFNRINDYHDIGTLKVFRVFSLYVFLCNMRKRVEVKVGDEWVKFDSFINDLKFYEKGRSILKSQGKKVGYSISCSLGDSSADFSLDGNKFIQMGSVREDHGVYDDPDEYFSSKKYNNNPGKFKMFIYRRYLKRLNGRIEAIRNS